MSIRKFFVAGYSSCKYFVRARQALEGMSAIFPLKVSATVSEYATKEEYMTWLATFRESINAPNHKTSPIIWLNDSDYIGGSDELMEFFRSYLSTGGESAADASKNMDAAPKDHGYDYDLVVIGGGSGGLACSKEAVRLGAKVAVLDYVKPSPLGSKWGLGGTCVNVGCIPKKLMHTAALLGEMSKDAVGYGWKGGDGAVHDWVTLREHVQEHIASLNFGYRVSLREEGITYLNKLGKFVGSNQLECTDKAGKSQTISAARFVIATGGRPSPLECPGGELALSSDDIFMKETAPGKTCVVGAGYVALECAGFLTGLKNGEVTVLVRSIPLRGFDRDVVGKVVDYMKASGTKIIEGALPTSIDKLPSGRLLVKFSNGGSDEFDTVLAATGRGADTAGLALPTVGVATNPKSGKIPCVNEQTNVPHIYAIGDVVEDAPELTPAAILAGRLLAQRLFAGSKKPMVYTNISTTVFTPLELGTVGLSEEAAVERYGKEGVDCYISSFSPLEWSIASKHGDVTCYAKIVVDTSAEKRVLGLHIAAPNAGEIIQGFAVAFRKGITYADLQSTVGIHPTTAEEFTVMSVTKSSGADAAKAGC